jgi:myxalamid-type polyketide synthase MxaB
VYGLCVLPGAAYVEMALKAGSLQMNGARPMVENIHLKAPLLIDGPRRIQLVLKPRDQGGFEFEIFSNTRTADEPWLNHASGQIARTKTDQKSLGKKTDPPEETASSFSREFPAGDYYANLSKAGFGYEGGFISLARILQIKPGEAMGYVKVDPALYKDADNSTYIFHPILLDACFQIVNSLIPVIKAKTKDSVVFLPVGFGRLVLYKKPGPIFWVHAKTVASSEKYFKADLTLILESGEIMGEIKDVTGRSVSRSRLLGQFQKPLWGNLYDLCWHQIPHKEKVCKEFNNEKSLYLLFSPGDDLSGDNSHGNKSIGDKSPENRSIGTELARLLEHHGHKVLVATPGKEFTLSADTMTCSMNPADPTHYANLFESLAKIQLPLRAIVHLWSLEDASTFERTSQLGWQSLLFLVQSVGSLGLKLTPHLWTVTRGMVGVNGETMETPPFHASLWGLGRSIMLEYPEFETRCLDLDASDVHPAETILTGIMFADAENQIAWRNGNRYGARLIAHDPFPDPEAKPVRVCLNSYDGLESLELAPLKRTPPKADEVEIMVHTAGLNFRDVLHALGMMQEVSAQMGIQDPRDLPLGFECSGTVVSRGEGVNHLKVGDPVIAAMAKGCLASFVTVPGAHVIKKPVNISFRAAATVSTVFLTAYHGLVNLANIKEGERILIHAAAGGVGTAAVQLARARGAVIFATASKSKWDVVRAMGATHVMDSRTVDFADEIEKHTHGKGVDVVLNSLTGEFIDHSFKALAKNGRFVEIGKIGIWTKDDVKMKRPDAAYYPFDMNDVALDDPESIAVLLKKMNDCIQLGNHGDIQVGIHGGEFKPLPFQSFGIQKVRDAFRHMAKAGHVGKVVITVNPSIKNNNISDRPDRPVGYEGGSYLISGGAGSLGIAVAHTLVDEGATHLILVTRSKPRREAVAGIKLLEKRGADVRVMIADVTDFDGLNMTWAEIKPELPPLRGVVHAAGILDDGMLKDQDAKRFQNVILPKVMGGWNLHRLTMENDLDFFVIFSSVASLFGNAGQASYAAANSFLDALAHCRRSSGLPCTSINWGAWEVGMAAFQDRLAAKGSIPFTVETGKALFRLILGENPVQIGAMAIDWNLFLQNHLGPIPPFLSQISSSKIGSSHIDGATNDQTGHEESSEIINTLKDSDPDERYDILLDFTAQLAANVLGDDQEQLILDQPLMEQGFDSLMAVELRNRLGREIDQTLPASLLFDYPTLEKITAYLTEEIVEFKDGIDSAKTQADESTTELSADDVLEELDNLLD